MKTESSDGNRAEDGGPDWIVYARPALGVAVFAVALWALHHALRGYPLPQLARSVRSVPALHLALALGLTAVNYLVLTGYDTLALRYLRTPLPYRKVALASFIGYAFANNTGTLSILTGGSVRYRLYTGWGLTGADIARVIGFCTLTFWLGFLALAGLTFLLEPLALPQALRLPLGSLHLLGVVFLAVVAGYLAWSGIRRTPIRIRDWQLEVPPLGLSAVQVALAAADWGLVGAVLYALLPAGTRPAFPLFLGLFLLAQVVGLASTVPGGLGVFESAMVLLLSPLLPADAVLGPLLAFRGIYYLVPLVAAALALTAHEALRRREALGRAARALGEPLARLVPQVLALGVFAAGAVLLFSGAAPAVASRLAGLRRAVPLPVIEVSHLAASVAGAGLLVLARALQRRVDAAYVLAVALLAVGIVASLLKGLDFEEAAVLAALLAALLPCRRQFHRKAALTAEIWSPGWAGAVAMVLAGSLWIGLLAYRHVEYRSDLWWQFALTGDAPRFLRASLAATVVLVALAAAKLLRPGGAGPAHPTPTDLEEAAAVASGNRSTHGYLALLGDKRLLWSAGRSAFVMYGVHRRSWVAVGDPVGPADEAEELLWAFRELCDRHGGQPVFYEVGDDNLALYLDLGLAPLKIGEAARVPLADFSLDGSARKDLRAARNRAHREGLSFEVAPAPQNAVLLAELRAVSDDWLREKNTREKGFSLGRFDEAYLARFPCGLVRRDGAIVGFANLLPGGRKDELSVDLMRFRPEAPHGTMDYLFTELLLWGRDRGYRCFDLGMAPLSGLEDRALAPLWTRLGAYLFRHGEHFYNFRGLRAYKQKFAPDWSPRYLVVHGGIGLPRALLDVAALVSGGVTGVLGK